MSKKSIFYTTADLNYSDVSPTLDLNFIENQKVPPFVNVTRNSQTTYVDKFGILRTADINQPVFEWDPITGKFLGARIWEVVANARPYSERILAGPDVAVYGAVNSTLVQQTATSPIQGLSTVSKLTLNNGANTGNSSDGMNFGSTVNLTVNTVYTQSIFVKAAGSSVLRLRSNVTGQVFDIPIAGSAPTPTGSISACTVQVFPSGWSRISWTFTAITGTPASRSDHWALKTDIANGTDGILMTGAMIQTGSTLGPYVPTTTTAASSTADVWSITGADFSRIINQTEGTIYIEYGPHDVTTPATNNSLLTITTSMTSAANIIESFAGANVAPVFRVESNSVNQAYITSSSYNPSAIHKLAAAYKVDDFARSLDTQSIGTDTSGALPAVAPSILEIGSRNFGGVKPLNGYIRRLTIYPKRLTNSQLVQLTE